MDTNGAGAGPETAAALIEAGRKLFAHHGFEGASVRAITAEARANLGAITYHFGSKQALYTRVVEACVQPLASRVDAAVAMPGRALDRVEGVVRAYFRHFRENPDLPQLMLQELALTGGPPPAAAPTLRGIFRRLVALIGEGQATGEIRSGEPALLAASIISQPVFLTVMRPALQAVADVDMADAGVRERVEAHAVAFVRAGLAARPEDGR